MTSSVADATMVGRVLTASTTGFSFGATRPRQNLPEFAALVRAETTHTHLYGLVFEVRVADDPLVRQLVAAAEVRQEVIRDQHTNRQAPVEINALAVGWRPRAEGPRAAVRHHLPPHPPLSLDSVHACDAAELAAFTGKFAYLNLVIAANYAPVEELLAAHLKQAAAVYPDETMRNAFLVSAGRALARAMVGDYQRLEALLRRISA